MSHQRLLEHWGKPVIAAGPLTKMSSGCIALWSVEATVRNCSLCLFYCGFSPCTLIECWHKMALYKEGLTLSDPKTYLTFFKLYFAVLSSCGHLCIKQMQK